MVVPTNICKTDTYPQNLHTSHLQTYIMCIEYTNIRSVIRCWYIIYRIDLQKVPFVTLDELKSPGGWAGPAFQVLRRKAIEQNKRLVVLFASQSVLEAIAMTIGADLSGKVRDRLQQRVR